MKPLSFEEVLEIAKLAFENSKIKHTDLQLEKYEANFTELYQEKASTLDKLQPAIFARKLLSYGKSKKFVGGVMRKDSSDVTSLLPFRSMYGDPVVDPKDKDARKTWTQDELKKSDTYLGLEYTIEDIDRLQAKFPEWNLAPVIPLLVPDAAESEAKKVEMAEA